MHALAFVALGFAPGLFFLWRIYLRNRYRPDPKHLVARTFLLGVAAAVPISLVESLIGDGKTMAQGAATVGAAAFTAFIVAGVVEELGKYLVVRSTVQDSPYCDEPMSGLVFASAAALGFASIENVVYMVEHGASVIVLRAPTSTVAHVAFSALWGYPFGAAKSPGADGLARARLALGLVAAIVAHGFYDYFLMKPDPSYWMTIVVLAITVAGFAFLLRRAVARSPNQARVARVVKQCQTCAATVRFDARFCVRCGDGQRPGVELVCASCGAGVAHAGRFCTACGCRLVRT